MTNHLQEEIADINSEVEKHNMELDFLSLNYKLLSKSPLALLKQLIKSKFQIQSIQRLICSISNVSDSVIVESIRKGMKRSIQDQQELHLTLLQEIHEQQDFIDESFVVLADKMDELCNSLNMFH
ncbi:hypothetical protein RCL1_007897 [Eukaryota sp. TZLM3-RCL]